MNPTPFIISAFIPLITGFIWYHPKVFGTTWMRVARLRQEDLKGGNMILIFALTLVFGFMLSFVLSALVIHQSGFYSSILGMPEATVANLKAEYERLALDNYRTFKHGMLHGFIAGLGFAMPVLAINSMFERRGAKYVVIHTAYWIITLMLMGGTICAMK